VSASITPKSPVHTSPNFPQRHVTYGAWIGPSLAALQYATLSIGENIGKKWKKML